MGRKLDDTKRVYVCPVCRAGTLITVMTLPQFDSNDTVYRRRCCGHCRQLFVTEQVNGEAEEIIELKGKTATVRPLGEHDVMKYKHTNNVDLTDYKEEF